jgi:hypothetical protein
MNQRPTSVTVISWFLIGTSALTLLTSFAMFNNPVARDLMAQNPIPIPVQYAMMYVGLSVSLTCGIFMLKGANWARLFYIFWSAFGFLVSLLTSPVKTMLIPGVVVFGVFVFFLTRPQATAFFKNLPPPPAQ